VRVRFEGFTYDTDTRELRRGDEVVRLSPKAFELLGVLIGHRPRPLKKEDLHDRLWPKTFVSEATLHSLVAEVRKALGDEPRKPRFVRTAQRFGYAFIAPLTADDAASPTTEGVSCRLIWGPREIALRDGENILGRNHDATAFIDSGGVSRRHARITVAGGEATLEDLGSKNGTRLRGERIAATTSLADGDEIRLGPVLLIFRRYSVGGTTRSEPS